MDEKAFHPLPFSPPLEFLSPPIETTVEDGIAEMFNLLFEEAMVEG